MSAEKVSQGSETAQTKKRKHQFQQKQSFNNEFFVKRLSKNIDEILKKKYKIQYNNVTFINNDSFHDRFIIIDKKKIYSCGASFKDLGKKCFAINEMDNKNYLKMLLKDIENTP